jgi:hypothetical protein
MKKINLHLLLILSFMFTATMGFARDYIIYSIAQDIPMGFDDEITKKNYYINMGADQGLRSGNLVDVFRIVSMNDPYESKKRYDYQFKIGELKVIHSEGSSSIAVLNQMSTDEQSPMLEIRNFMVGDRVNVNVNQ